MGLLERIRRVKPAPPLTPLQRRLVAFRSYRPVRSPAWPPRADDRFAGQRGIPEIPASELDLQALISGIQHHGSIIVRGVLSEEQCATYRSTIDAVLERIKTGPAVEDELYRVLTEPDGSAPVAHAWRTMRATNGLAGDTALTIDCPSLLDRLIGDLRSASVLQLIADYLGETPALSLQKANLRRAAADVVGSWHQDGAFLGSDVRSVNVWLALSRCGDIAPGMDIVGKRLDRVVETGAYFSWDVADGTVATVAGDDEIVTPVFNPGDMILFDDLLLHRTSPRSSKQAVRYAIESWFFAPSAFPAGYDGVLIDDYAVG